MCTFFFLQNRKSLIHQLLPGSGVAHPANAFSRCLTTDTGATRVSLPSSRPLFLTSLGPLFLQDRASDELPQLLPASLQQLLLPPRTPCTRLRQRERGRESVEERERKKRHTVRQEVKSVVVPTFPHNKEMTSSEDFLKPSSEARKESSDRRETRDDRLSKCCLRDSRTRVGDSSLSLPLSLSLSRTLFLFLFPRLLPPPFNFTASAAAAVWIDTFDD